VHGDAVEPVRMTETIPIGLLHLTRFVRIEEEVAARGAAGERPDHAWFDDASSGHAESTSENCACDSGCVLP